MKICSKREKYSYSSWHILPGHGSVLQPAAWVESPEQYAPPLLGAGFVQLLVLDLDPVPQLKLHSL